MSTAAYVPLEIDQGEDFFASITWTDQYDAPIPVVAPVQMDIKKASGAPVLSLSTADNEIAVSDSTGTIQITITKAQTAALVPGDYVYDLFATLDDPITGTKVDRLIAGPVTINKRITVMA